MKFKRNVAFLLLVITLISTISGLYATDQYLNTPTDIIGVSDVFTESASKGEQIFSDVDSDDWYYFYVQEMYNLRLVTGCEDGTFKPLSHVTAGEFFTMVCRIIDADLTEYRSEDPAAQHWAFPAAKKMKSSMGRYFEEIKLTSSYLDTPITREAAVKSALYVTGVKYPCSHDLFEHPFTDLENGSATHTNWFVSAYQLGIISGNDAGEANMKGTLTRAEACKILYNLNLIYKESILAGHDGIQEPLPTALDGLNIKLVGDYSESHVPNAAKSLSYFPQDLVDTFIRDNGQIIITDEDPSKYGISTKAHATGCYFPGQAKIVLFTDGKPNSFSFSITDTLCHEFGHYLWDRVIEPNDKQTIQSSFRSEELNKIATALASNYCKTSVEEYWADLVSHYVREYDYRHIRVMESGCTNALKVLAAYLNTDNTAN